MPPRCSRGSRPLLCSRIKVIAFHHREREFADDGSARRGSLPGSPPVATSTGLVASLAEAAGEALAKPWLLSQLALRDIRIRYKQAVMGFGWAI